MKDAEKKPNILTIMAQQYNLGDTMFMNTLKATVMKPDKTGKVPSNEEIAAFLLVAHKYDLNPFTKEIYAFPDKRAGIIPIVGIDGFVTLANRHPEFNGYDLEWSPEEKEQKAGKRCPEWCEIKVYRKDRDHPITVREYLDEVYQEPRGGFPGPWQTHTRRMLRHKTMIQGFRVAFGFTGIYDEDEANRIAISGDIIDMPTAGKPDVSMPQELPKQTQSEESTPEPNNDPIRIEKEDKVCSLLKTHFPKVKDRDDWMHARFAEIKVEKLSNEKLEIALKCLEDLERK